MPVKAGGKLIFTYGILESFNAALKRKYDFKYRGPAWDRAFTFVYSHWLEHLKKLGITYDDFYLQVWDEALREEAAEAIEGCKLMRKIDPKVKLVMDGYQNIDEVKAFDPYIDVWIPNFDVLLRGRHWKKLLDFYHNVNEPVFGYTSNVYMKSVDVNSYFRLRPWYAARLGLNGVFFWAYNSWSSDSWNDFDGKGDLTTGLFFGDNGVIYRGMDEPVSSRRWEASRDGLEDWQLIRLVKNLSPQKELQSEVNKIITDVISHYDKNTFADKGRQALIKLGVQEAGKNPLKTDNVKARQKNGAAKISFNTNHKSSGKLLYKISGADKWNSTEIASNTKHKISVSFPFDVKIDWLILVWDEQGRVAYKFKGE